MVNPNMMTILSDVYHYIITKLYTLIEYVWKIFVLILLLFEEIKPILISVLVLIVLDQFTGLWKAIYFRQFEWKKFNRLYAKVILYLTVIMSTYVYGQFILELPDHYFTKGIAAVIGFQELSSSYLNVSKITGKEYIKEYIDKLKNIKHGR